MRTSEPEIPVRRAPRSHPIAAVAFGALLAVGLAGCSDSADEDATSVDVTGTDSACELAETELDAGKINFEFTNEASQVSELYVLRDNGDVVSEVENVTTGTSRTLTVDLTAGDYRVTCKPGQSGDGLSSDFVVTGEGGTEQAEADRTITFDAHDFDYTGLEALDDVTVGETIRFEMTNSGEQAHEFEVILPSGEALGEVASIDPGEEGGATMTFDEEGTYMFQCILIDEESGEPHTELGMVGTFEIS